MTVLLLSDGSLLARALVERSTYAGLSLTEVRIVDTRPFEGKQLEALFPEAARQVINAVGLPDPRASEISPALSRELNHDWQRRVAQLCADKDLPLIAFSSCYVFDGLKQTHYIASNPGKPVGNLGRDLWEFEQWLRTHVTRHVLLRLGWRTDVMMDWIRQGAPGVPMAFSSHLRGSPVTAQDIARVTIAVIQQLSCDAELWGTFQYAGSETVSQYDLAVALAATLVQAGVTGWPTIVDGDPPTRAIEPVNATLGCTKIRNTYGIKQLPWRAQIAAEARSLIQRATSATR